MIYSIVTVIKETYHNKAICRRLYACNPASVGFFLFILLITSVFSCINITDCLYLGINLSLFTLKMRVGTALRYIP